MLNMFKHESGLRFGFQIKYVRKYAVDILSKKKVVKLLLL